MIPWPEEQAARFTLACSIAGLLAEHGVQQLRVAAPGACRAWTLRSRESNLPEQLANAAVGTAFSGEGVALLVDERDIKWVATDSIGADLRALVTPA